MKIHKAKTHKTNIHWLGVDTGGTFTDFVYYDGVSIRIHKVLSTPAAPEQAILQGIKELQISLTGLRLIHGSTVATNAVLEAKGVKTLYITNKGFADVLSIGRQARGELYELMPQPVEPLIAPECCLEVSTRLSASGVLLQDLDESELSRLCEKILKLKPRAIAINLLFSFLDSQQERIIKSFLENKVPDVFVCCSSDVLPEYKEYERGMATALNAYVGPLMQGYLNRLNKKLQSSVDVIEDKPALAVLQSSGGSIQAEQAGEHAVNLLLSGPAGGLKGAQYVAALSGEHKCLSFDMGGTSTDVALIEGEIKLTSEGHIGHYPVAVPMVDMHTIGAGGGSLAYVDDGGLLNVGPESAGAKPGPACYAQGGTQATVTDANLVLGRLQPNAFLGEGMRLDVAAAKNAVGEIAQQIGHSIEQTAQGIIRIANEHMVSALRKISVQRGFDPQDFTLSCFGGAGGLHVCALANALKMHRAFVPVYGGVLSALGMLVAAPSRELSQSCIQNLLDSDVKKIENLFVDMAARGVEDMRGELKAVPDFYHSLDLRYKGQSFTLNLPWLANLKNVEQAFHQLHKKTYGHQLKMQVELVNVRLSIKGEASPFALPKIKSAGVQPSIEFIKMSDFDQSVPIYKRVEMINQQIIKGPALIIETVSTTLIEKDWVCKVDAWGNLLLRREV